MEEPKQVYSKVDSGIITITINHPELKNGLTWQGITRLADCYEQLMADDKIRLAVITGNDEYFYTGGRVDTTVPGEKEKYADAIERFEKLAAANSKPLIAAVSGHCLKAGMGVIASCDFAIAKDNVEFGFPEIRMGGVPMMVMAETIGCMPKKRALEAYLTGWNFSAQDAYAMGLINRVTSAEDFWPTVERFVRVFLETPEFLIEMTRRAYNTMDAMHNAKERSAFAIQMLRSEVLTTMANTKTEYNV